MASFDRHRRFLWATCIFVDFSYFRGLRELQSLPRPVDVAHPHVGVHPRPRRCRIGLQVRTRPPTRPPRFGCFYGSDSTSTAKHAEQLFRQCSAASATAAQYCTRGSHARCSAIVALLGAGSESLGSQMFKFQSRNHFQQRVLALPATLSWLLFLLSYHLIRPRPRPALRQA